MSKPKMYFLLLLLYIYTTLFFRNTIVFTVLLGRIALQFVYKMVYWNISQYVHEIKQKTINEFNSKCEILN